ncbi:CBS domain-containing protein [Methanoculleus sp. FWC-SCC1]|uniref:CBS domain-containing protein n=1 Tax=Methanoculleus frigidifontis TaxID=2584085 RepID=A0ABT8M675_9EURY|nr:CBS domain-containing protein [Methanoculleus sp. FWC-SCC1]MDN7023443.1 CBS domain-containing protein [Methanoculleus sp. FWC-SCC1]
MDIPTPAELKAKRMQLGLKQADVARLAGISQSMVARIEAGSVDPRTSTLIKIVDVLKSAENSTLTAADIMHTPVLCVSPSDPISRAVEIMGKNSISQLPVIESGVPVGCISESAIINAMESGGLQKTHAHDVRDFMEPGFPTVPHSMPVETVVHILQQNHAVIVLDKGKVQGVITKHDLISLIV